MNLPKLTDDLNIISSLANRPTETSEDLKAKFDEAGNIIKTFLNNRFIETLKTELENEIELMKNQVASSLNNLRPVGSLYITTTEENPADIWTGTEWEKIQDVFLLASGKREVGTTGGAEEVTMGIENLPPHAHPYSKTTGKVSYIYDNTLRGQAVESITTTQAETEDVGEGKAIEIMPPYLAVNVWKRIS